MKGKMRKLVAFMLATIMVLAMGMTASAQQVGTGADNTATITINNALQFSNRWAVRPSLLFQ